MLLFSFRFCLLAWWCGGRFAVGGFTFRLGCLSSSAFSYLVGERGEDEEADEGEEADKGEEGGLGVWGLGELDRSCI